MKDFKFNKEGHYYELDGKRMYGITNVLNVIAKPALIGWAARMACEYVKNSKVWELVPNTPRKIMIGDKELDTLLEEAKNAHRKKKEDAADKGHDTHSQIEEIILYALANTNGYITGSKSENAQIQHFIDWAIKNNIKFLESEKQLYNEDLFIAGTVDLVFEKDGKIFIGDIKTYAKLWDRTPMLQCAAYGLMYEKMFGKKIDGYCVLLLTKTGEFKEQWSYDVSGDTEGFLAAYKLFKTLENWN